MRVLFKIAGFAGLIGVGVYCWSPEEFRRIAGHFGIELPDGPAPDGRWEPPDDAAVPPAPGRFDGDHPHPDPRVTGDPLATWRRQPPDFGDGPDIDADPARRIYGDTIDPRTLPPPDRRGGAPQGPSLVQLETAARLAYLCVLRDPTADALRKYDEARREYEAARARGVR